jgi:hypothetical protein
LEDDFDTHGAGSYSSNPAKRDQITADRLLARSRKEVITEIDLVGHKDKALQSWYQDLKRRERN